MLRSTSRRHDGLSLARSTDLPTDFETSPFVHTLGGRGARAALANLAELRREVKDLQAKNSRADFSRSAHPAKVFEPAPGLNDSQIIRRARAGARTQGNRHEPQIEIAMPNAGSRPAFNQSCEKCGGDLSGPAPDGLPARRPPRNRSRDRFRDGMLCGCDEYGGPGRGQDRDDVAFRLPYTAPYAAPYWSGRQNQCDVSYAPRADYRALGYSVPRSRTDTSFVNLHPRRGERDRHARAQPEDVCGDPHERSHTTDAMVDYLPYYRRLLRDSDVACAIKRATPPFPAKPSSQDLRGPSSHKLRRSLTALDAYHHESAYVPCHPPLRERSGSESVSKAIQHSVQRAMVGKSKPNVELRASGHQSGGRDTRLDLAVRKLSLARQPVSCGLDITSVNDTDLCDRDLHSSDDDHSDHEDDNDDDDDDSDNSSVNSEATSSDVAVASDDNDDGNVEVDLDEDDEMVFGGGEKDGGSGNRGSGNRGNGNRGCERGDFKSIAALKSAVVDTSDIYTDRTESDSFSKRPEPSSSSMPSSVDPPAEPPAANVLQDIACNLAPAAGSLDQEMPPPQSSNDEDEKDEDEEVKEEEVREDEEKENTNPSEGPNDGAKTVSQSSTDLILERLSNFAGVSESARNVRELVRGTVENLARMSSPSRFRGHEEANIVDSNPTPSPSALIAHLSPKSKPELPQRASNNVAEKAAFEPAQGLVETLAEACAIKNGLNSLIPWHCLTRPSAIHYEGILPLVK